MRDRLKAYRDEEGNLPGYAWPGGYPIIYIARDGGVLCPKCVNSEDNCTFGNDEGDSTGWEIEAADIYYEGPPLFCDNCSMVIESAYGDPESEGE